MYVCLQVPLLLFVLICVAVKGIILTNTDSRYPHRIEDRKNLPLGAVTEGVVLNAQQFLNQTKAVFVLNKETCRHYLLVKDLSGNNKNHQ